MQNLYYNGTILTMEGENDTVEAVLTDQGKIMEAGTLDEVKKAAEPEVHMTDLQGKTLMPAFIDGHGHITMAAQMSGVADLSECTTFESIILALKDYQKEHQVTEEGLVFGFGYDHNFLPGGKHPTKEYLNQVSETIPVFISHTSGHMGCANDAALRLAGITAETANPQGGVIGRVDGSREPNGYLEEAGMINLQMCMGSRMKMDVMEAGKKAQALYLQNGITTVQDGAATEDTVKMARAWAAAGILKVDIVAYAMVNSEPQKVLAENEDCVERYVDRFKLGGFKAVLDGSPQGKSAWLTKPYENSGDYCAYSWFQDEQVEEYMRMAVDSNHQILVHCNGDAAGDQYLRAYKKALELSHNPNKYNLRPVMIHCQTAREDQLDLMAELKMIPSIFVGHVYYWGDVHLKNLGEMRGNRISPCRSALDRGLIMNLHQDTPVTKPKMLHSVWCAVNRITRNGVKLGQEQRISVYEALKAVTINAAYSYFEEDSKGSIKKGKLADLVILDQNPMTVDPMKIKDIQVLETIKEGESVYTC